MAFHSPYELSGPTLHEATERQAKKIFDILKAVFKNSSVEAYSSIQVFFVETIWQRFS